MPAVVKLSWTHKGENCRQRFARIRQTSRGVIIPCAIVVLWFCAAKYSWIPSSLLPSPAAVLDRSYQLMISGSLERHISASLLRLVGGLLLGGFSGIAVGILVGMHKALEDILAPTLRFLTPVPVLAWMPLIIVFLGVGEAAKVSLLAIGVFFILFSATTAAVRSIDARMMEVARLYRKNLSETIAKVVLPGCAPAIFEAIRGAVALSWVVLVAAEIVASNDGLGWLLWDARTFGRADDTYVAMITIGALGFSTDWLARLIRVKVVRWRNDFGGI